jgi:type II secretory pathway pseudopilin PulG
MRLGSAAARFRGSGDPDCRASSDEGSLLVVVVLATVISLVGLALVTRAVGELSNSRQVQDLAAARSEAQAALENALFQMSQEQGSLSSFCVVPPGDSSSVSSSANCSKTSIIDGAEISYSATTTGPNTYALSIEATVHGATVAAAADTKRVPSFPFALFAGSAVTFNGAGSSITIHATDAYGNPTGAPADVGSDGTITCNGSGEYGTNQVTFDGGSSNCPAWVTNTSTYDPPQPVASCPPAQVTTPPTPCMPANPQPCPNGGDFSTGTSAPFILEPGVYDCSGNLTFGGTVEVDYSAQAQQVNNGEVQIFDFPPSGTKVDLQLQGATVNQWETPPPASPAVVGNPADLQVYVAGSCQGPEQLSHDTLFDGYLYAPGCSIKLNGGQLTYTGAFVVNELTVNGNPNMVINYDERMSELVPSTWVVSNFAWVPPSQFSL